MEINNFSYNKIKNYYEFIFIDNGDYLDNTLIIMDIMIG